VLGLGSGWGEALASVSVLGSRPRAYLASEGLGECLPIGTERARSVVPQQVLQLCMRTVLAQHHMATVPELGQQEVAAASPAPGGHHLGLDSPFPLRHQSHSVRRAPTHPAPGSLTLSRAKTAAPGEGQCQYRVPPSFMSPALPQPHL
jgi:hypothetical protein